MRSVLSHPADALARTAALARTNEALIEPQRGELKHLTTRRERKSTETPSVAASESGGRPLQFVKLSALVRNWPSTSVIARRR